MVASTSPRTRLKQVVVVDDLSNSVEESLSRVRELTKCKDDQLIFRKVRERDREAWKRGEGSNGAWYVFCAWLQHQQRSYKPSGQPFSSLEK